jgi:hypothetical protein
MTLTLIFGVWMNIAQITYLAPSHDGCVVYFGGYRSTEVHASCEETASAIDGNNGHWTGTEVH